jgi:plasmid stabilization system protein ParE
MDRLFSDAVGHLADFPMLGHVGEIAGTRELTPHRSYRIVYEVVEKQRGFWFSSIRPGNGHRRMVEAIEQRGDKLRLRFKINSTNRFIIL